MSILHFTAVRPREPSLASLTPTTARGLFAVLLLAAAAAGFLATDPVTARAAQAAAGADLTRLLRAMVLIKAVLAACAVGAVVWRLGWPVSPGRLAVYASAGATMAVGPGLIWGMAHVGLGALLLHAGLASTVVLLWRDPGVGDAFAAILKRRAARR